MFNLKINSSVNSYLERDANYFLLGILIHDQ